MNGGYLFLYRSLKEKGYYRNSKIIHLWIHLLLSATHQEREFLWNGKIIKIKEGEFITGRKNLHLETSLSESFIERTLKLFENEQQIIQQKTNKYRLIKILNWDKAQKLSRKVNNSEDNKWTTNGQQMDTYNTVKNEKNDKKLSEQSSEGNITNNLISLFKEINPNYEILFKRKPQRGAIERLVKKHGQDKIEATIKALPAIVSQKYAPRITTPIQLEEKLGELVVFYKQEQNKVEKNKSKVAIIQ